MQVVIAFKKKLVYIHIDDFTVCINIAKNNTGILIPDVSYTRILPYL